MKKLTEAGKLYLQDFYILNEAQNDVFAFLDAVINQVYQDLEETVKNLPEPGEHFAWKIWDSKSKPGLLEVWPSATREIAPFSKGKEDIYVTCCDVRREGELHHTDSVGVSIQCSHGFFSRLKNEVPFEILEKGLKAAKEQGTNISVNKRRVLYKEEVKLELDSVSDSADSVSEFIMERCRGVREFALQIVKPG